MTIEERAKKIRLLMMDVDGVLTGGHIVYDNYGDELKFFSVHDGFGIRLLQHAGIKTIIITANNSKVVRRRAKELKITKLYQRAIDKLKLYNKILKKFRLTDEEVCFIGDDLIDLPVLSRVGLSVTVPNGTLEHIKDKVHYITRLKGGEGAVREVIELILKSQDKWRTITEKYFL